MITSYKDMELLSLTCKTLYDNDILIKNNQLKELQNRLRTYEYPKALYTNMDEMERAFEHAVNIITEHVNDCVTYNHFEYQFMRSGSIGPGITPRQRIIISDSIITALDFLAKTNNKWGHEIAYQLVDDFNQLVESFDECGIWLNIIEQIDSSTMADLILTFIKKKLEFYILPYIALFQCGRCKTITTYLGTPSQLCIECEEIANKIKECTINI
tara:strand:+ start:191 stop:832 length:642 start_codon:yes stop_codon:yes gene_type:complete